MNKYLKQLVELSEIDTKIDSFPPRIEKIEKTLRSSQDEKETSQGKINALEDEIKEATLKKRQHNTHLSELSDKLKGVSKKTSSAKNEKEIKALQLEEEITKEQCDFANEEIARLEKVIDSKQTQIDEFKKELETLEQNILKIEQDISSELKNIEEEKKIVFAKKEDLVSKMSSKILTFYEKIRKWANNTAVVPVRKQACYGCFMRIYDKTYSAVVKSEDIVTCPHCGRILYKEVQEEEATA